MNRLALLLGAGVVVLVVLAYLAVPSIAARMATPTPASQPEHANPAAVYCVEHDYRYELRNGPNGQAGVCVFPDRSECDEWAFYRGQCGARWQTPTR